MSFADAVHQNGQVGDGCGQHRRDEAADVQDVPAYTPGARSAMSAQESRTSQHSQHTMESEAWRSDYDMYCEVPQWTTWLGQFTGAYIDRFAGRRPGLVGTTWLMIATSICVVFIATQNVRFREIHVANVEGSLEWFEEDLGSPRMDFSPGLVTDSNQSVGGRSQVELLRLAHEREVQMYAQFTLYIIYEMQEEIFFDSGVGAWILREASAFENDLRKSKAWETFCGRGPEHFRRLCNPGLSLASYMAPTMQYSNGQRFLSTDGLGQDMIPSQAAWQLVERDHLDKVFLPFDPFYAAHKVPVSSAVAFRSSFTFTLPCCSSASSASEQRQSLEQLRKDWFDFFSGELIPRLTKLIKELRELQETTQDGIPLQIWYETEGLQSIEASLFLSGNAKWLFAATGVVLLVLMTLVTGSPFLGLLAAVVLALSSIIAFVLVCLDSKLLELGFVALVTPAMVAGLAVDIVCTQWYVWDGVAKACGREVSELDLLQLAHIALASDAWQRSCCVSSVFLAALLVDAGSVQHIGFVVCVWLFTAPVVCGLIFLPLCSVEDRTDGQFRIDWWGRCLRFLVGEPPQYENEEGQEEPGEAQAEENLDIGERAGDGMNQVASSAPSAAPSAAPSLAQVASRPSLIQSGLTTIGNMHDEMVLQEEMPPACFRTEEEPKRQLRLCGPTQILGAVLVTLSSVGLAMFVGSTQSLGKILPEDHNKVAIQDLVDDFAPSASYQDVFADPPPTTEGLVALTDFRHSTDAGDGALFACEADPALQAGLDNRKGCTCYGRTLSPECANSTVYDFARRLVADGVVSDEDLAENVDLMIKPGRRPREGEAVGFDKDAVVSRAVGPSVALIQSWETGRHKPQQVMEIQGTFVVGTESDPSAETCIMRDICFCGDHACKLPNTWSMIDEYKYVGGHPETPEWLEAHASSPPAENDSVREERIYVVCGISEPGAKDPLRPPNFPKTFVPSNLWAQRSLYEICHLPDKEELLIVEQSCWLAGFRSWLHAGNHRFPVLEDAEGSRYRDWKPVVPNATLFNKLAIEYAEHVRDDLAAGGSSSDGDIADMPESLWIRDGEVKAWVMGFTVEIPNAWTARDVATYKKKWDSYIADWNGRASPLAGTAWHTSGLWQQGEPADAALPASIPGKMGPGVIGAVMVSVGLPSLGSWLALRSMALLMRVLAVAMAAAILCGLLVSATRGGSIGPPELMAVFVSVGYSVQYTLRFAMVVRPRELGVRLGRYIAAGFAVIRSAFFATCCVLPLAFSSSPAIRGCALSGFFAILSALVTSLGPPVIKLIGGQEALNKDEEDEAGSGDALGTLQVQVEDQAEVESVPSPMAITQVQPRQEPMDDEFMASRPAVQRPAGLLSMAGSDDRSGVATAAQAGAQSDRRPAPGGEAPAGSRPLPTRHGAPLSAGSAELFQESHASVSGGSQVAPPSGMRATPTSEWKFVGSEIAPTSSWRGGGLSSAGSVAYY